jgi:hypothetical protein
MIARNSNSPPPPTTMLAQTMVIGPQTNIVNGEGGKLGIFWKIYELISMIVYKVRHLVIFDPKQRLLYFNTWFSFWVRLLYLPCARLLCNFFGGEGASGRVWANCLATEYLKVFNFDRFNMLSNLWHKVCLWVPWNIFEVYIYTCNRINLFI